MTELFIQADKVLGREILPLRLVPIEQFMLWDDTPAYPKRFRVLLDLSGNLNRTILERSIVTAAQRHIMLTARLDWTEKTPRWILPTEPAISFRWLEGSWQDPPFPDEWDLQKESGVRIWVSQSEGRYQVSFDVHHATSDGLGMRQFVADVILAYDYFFNGGDGEPELKKLLPERLIQRGSFSRPKPSSDARSTTLWEKVKQAFSFHVLGPVPLVVARRNARKQPTTSRHIYRRIVLDKSQAAAWDRSLDAASSTHESNAQSGEVNESTSVTSTFNDRVTARLFQVLADWNKKHGKASGRQRLRIMLPTDLRTYSDGRLPAANRLGFGFVVTNAQSCDDLEMLLEQVTAQTQAIRKLSLGLDFVDIFGGLTAVPELAKRLIRIPRCMATGVLTNLGDLSRRHRRGLVDATQFIKMGNLRLDCVTCFPPLRPKTAVGLGVCGTRDNLTIGLVLDSASWSEEDADRLLQAVCFH